MWLGVFLANLGFLLSAFALVFLPAVPGSLVPAALAFAVLAYETRALPFVFAALGCMFLEFDTRTWALFPWILAGAVAAAYPFLHRDWPRLLSYAVGTAGAAFATFVVLLFLGLPGDLALIALWVAFFAALAACAMWYRSFESTVVQLAATAILMYMLAALLFFVPATPNVAAAAFPLVLFHGVTGMGILFMYMYASSNAQEDKDDYDVYFTPLEPS